MKDPMSEYYTTRMIVGFTGTLRGMSHTQLGLLPIVLSWFKRLQRNDQTNPEFHHGGAKGADREAAIIARRTGYRVIWHPAPGVCLTDAFASDPSCEDDEWLEVFPPLERDHHIAEQTHVLIAGPKQDQEELRSGTWATIRYARKAGKPIIMLPRGKDFTLPLDVK